MVDYRQDVAENVGNYRVSNEFGDLSIAARASAVRSGARFSIPGMIIMTAVLFFVDWLFSPLVTPAWHLDLWLLCMFTTVGFWLAAIIAFFRRKPSDEETVEHWPIYGRIAQKSLNIGIAVSPWLLLPNADIALQYFTTIMYVWYVAVSIITGNPSARLSVWEVVMLTGSVAGFAIYSEVEFGVPLAALLAVIGASMLGLRRLVQTTVLTAFDAQQASVASEAVSRNALATVAAQRDAKTRFIASASHDLQQPIFAARLGLQATIALPEGDRRDQFLRDASAALGSAQGLIDAMLDHLRLDAGDVVVRAHQLPTKQLLDGIAREYRAAAEAVGLRMRVVSGGCVVVADPQLVARAIGNLVHNSIRHSGAARLLLAARRRQGKIEIWIVDDGCGLGGDSADWLFKEFAKGNVSARRGLGLGLASARRHLALMDGSIDAVTGWHSGAAFVICLPEAMADA
jgi:signal transduction histidine kinase